MTETGEAKKMKPEHGFRIAILIAVVLVAYGPAIMGLAEIWWIRYDFSHGFLVPLISLYLVWEMRARLGGLPTQPSVVWGLPIAVLAGILLVLAQVGGMTTLGGVSLIVMLTGLIVLVLGKVHLKALAFPLAYLWFMIPIWDIFIGPLHLPFQLLTAKMAVPMIQMVGIPAMVTGQYIWLPNITLEVAQVCSGVSFVVAIVAIGLPLGYLSLRSWWSRTALIGIGLVIAVAANWARVMFIGVWAYWEGEVLHGPFHVFQGLFVAWIGFAALFAGAWALSRVEHSVLAPAKKSLDLPESTQERPSVKKDRVLWVAIIAVGMLAAYTVAWSSDAVPLKRDFSLFPITLGDWKGEQAAPEGAIVRVDGADHELWRIYRNHEGRVVHLYVAYLAAQQQEKELVNYRTAILHQDMVERVFEISAKRFIVVNQGRFEDRDRVYRMLFWYDINGEIIADRYKAKLATIRQALLERQTNGALVVVAFEDEGQGNQLGKADEAAFVRELLPRLRWFLP